MNRVTPIKPYQTHANEVSSYKALASLMRHTLDYRIVGGLYAMCQKNRQALYLACVNPQRITLTG